MPSPAHTSLWMQKKGNISRNLKADFSVTKILKHPFSISFSAFAHVMGVMSSVNY